MTLPDAFTLFAWLLALATCGIVWRRGGPYAEWGRIAFLLLTGVGVLVLGVQIFRDERAAREQSPPPQPRDPPLPPVHPVEIEALDHLTDGTNRRIQEIDDEIEDIETLADDDRPAADVARDSRFADRLGGVQDE